MRSWAPAAEPHDASGERKRSAATAARVGARPAEGWAAADDRGERKKRAAARIFF